MHEYPKGSDAFYLTHDDPWEWWRIEERVEEARLFAEKGVTIDDVMYVYIGNSWLM